MSGCRMCIRLKIHIGGASPNQFDHVLLYRVSGSRIPWFRHIYAKRRFWQRRGCRLLVSCSEQHHGGPRKRDYDPSTSQGVLVLASIFVHMVLLLARSRLCNYLDRHLSTLQYWLEFDGSIPRVYGSCNISPFNDASSVQRCEVEESKGESRIMLCQKPARKRLWAGTGFSNSSITIQKSLLFFTRPRPCGFVSKQRTAEIHWVSYHCQRVRKARFRARSQYCRRCQNWMCEKRTSTPSMWA